MYYNDTDLKKFTPVKIIYDYKVPIEIYVLADGIGDFGLIIHDEEKVIRPQFKTLQKAEEFLQDLKYNFDVAIKNYLEDLKKAQTIRISND